MADASLEKLCEVVASEAAVAVTNTTPADESDRNMEPCEKENTKLEQVESYSKSVGNLPKQTLTSIRMLTFEALKAIESATNVENSLLKKAKSNLTDLIAKSLASNNSKDCQSKDSANSQPSNTNVNIVNKDRYKTELCRKFMENSSCPYSKKCQFAHGYHELKPVARHPRYRTELCREYFNHGLCTYGTRCNFIHQLPGEEDKSQTKELNSVVGKADDDVDEDNLLGSISNVEGSNERPYTPSNDSGLSFSLDTPVICGRYSPIESTRLSERSESPSELLIIHEVLREDEEDGDAVQG